MYKFFTVVIVLLVFLLTSPFLARADDSTALEAAPKLVEVTSVYNGSRLTAYGICPQPCEIVLTLKGAPRTFELYKRTRHFGLWTNPVVGRLKKQPAYWAVAGTPASGAARADLAELLPEARLVLAEKALWPERVLPVDVLPNGLFTARFPIPPSAVQGDYTLEAQFLRPFRAPETKKLSVQVVPAGLSARLKRYATKNRLGYGFLCLFVALSIGGGGYTLLRRD